MPGACVSECSVTTWLAPAASENCCGAIVKKDSVRSSVTAVATSRQGRRALTSDGDEIKLLELDRNAELELYKASGQGVRALCFSPDGRHFASVGADGFVRVWATSAGEKRK